MNKQTVQSTDAGQQPEALGADERAVIDAMHALGQACVNPDRATLEQLIDPQVRFAHSNGLVETREEFVGPLLEGQPVFRSMTFNHPTVQCVGDIALVQHDAVYITFSNGKDGRADIHVSQVWVRVDGRWRLRIRTARKHRS